MKRDVDTDERHGDADKGGESDRALVILDMTREGCRGSADLERAVADIGRFVLGELRYFRERGRLVVFASSTATASSSSSILPGIRPRSDEIVLTTATSSAFAGTDLDTILQRMHIARVTLVGIETHTTVLATADDAARRGYGVVVPETCVAAADPVVHAAALRRLRATSTTGQLSAGAAPRSPRPDASV